MAVALSGLLRASPRHVRTCSATSVSVTNAMTRMCASQRGHTKMSATSGGLGCGAMRERRRLLGPKTP